MNNLRFIYAPDAPGSSNDDPSNKTTGLPRKDVDFKDVAKAVAENWLLNPDITLAYTNAAAFNVLVTSYATQLSGRVSTGGGRPVLTQTLAQLDDSIDDAITEVKVYLQKKYKKDNAPAHYAKFGIAKQNDSYQLPRDRNKRLLALELTRAAITTEGFNNEEYGTNFWDNTYIAYEAALKNTGNTDGQISEQVAGKNSDKEQIKKVMKSLRKVLEGNYPDTYKSVYRTWGWQKEDY